VRKVCVVIGSRANYGSIKSVMRAVRAHPELKLQLIVGASALLDRFGSVVSRDALSKAGWPNGTGGRNALDVHVLRLRRRLDAVGLAIRTVRARGYLLEVGVPSDRQLTSPY
jgi:DNA-binding response OmpR family regulator